MKWFIPCLALFTAVTAHARVVEYDLTIAEQKLSPAGKPVRVLTVNGGLPGPTLRFKEGDTARVRVHNRLPSGETSVHWHGLLLPNVQDGVPYVTTPPIHTGQTRVFEFPLKHSGTYWYHSHTGLQEQIGVYGSIVVEPKGGEPVKADREHVLVLSDWTNENPNEVMRTLMRGSDWYAIRKGNQQSLLGAARAGALKDWFQREWTRMPPMDVSDVAYDAFLVNGRPSQALAGKPGERIRLRLINASASTYFYVQSSTGPLTLVAADGPPIRPLKQDRLLMGMAETYDAIITIPPSGRWEIRATAMDGSGHASAWVGNGTEHPAPDVPKPDLYRMDHMLEAAMADMDMADMKGMDMKGMDMKGMGQAMPAGDGDRPAAPYAKLRSPESTAFPASAPRRVIPLRLTGDMERYIWSMNGETVQENGTIPVKRGEVLRLELVNDTMMHHPMHLHGHFFRVINGQGAYSPLKHTVDVPPMGKRVIEFAATEQGDWLFHCHLLYHMHAGMTRVFSYDDQGPDHKPDLGEMGEDPLMFMLEGTLLNHMSMGMATVMTARNDFMLTWDLGYGDHGDHAAASAHAGHGMGGMAMKEDDDDVEYEIDAVWRRYVNPNFSAFGGYRFTNRDDEENRFIAGIDYRLPLLVATSLSLDSEGNLRIGIGKSVQLTDRLSLFADVRYDTGTEWEWSVGADYVLSKRFSLVTQYHSEHGLGGGIGFRF